MNRKLLATAVAGAIAPMAAQALDVSVSGHVARAIRYADNGANSDIQHVDHSASPSRITFSAEGEAMPGLTFGATQELGVQANNGWAMDVEAADTGRDINIRQSYLYLSGAFGKVTLGHTNVTGDGIMFESHNGAWMGTEYSADTNSGINVMTENDMPSGYTVAGFFVGATGGLGRKAVLRYDSPAIGPVSVSASTFKPDPYGMDKGAEGQDTDHSWSFSAKLKQDVGAVAVKGGIGYAEDMLGISGGLAFPNGTSVNAAWGQRDYPNMHETRPGWDSDDFYVNLAHTWGNLSLAIDYRGIDWEMPRGSAADPMLRKADATAIGLGANYSLGSGVDLFAGFHNYSFDSNTAELQDVNSFHIGSRVKFN